MTTENKHELFEILKGPQPMKSLCEKYIEYKGANFFQHFNDNGDCEDHETDWIYNGIINHYYQGDFYAIQCCIRDAHPDADDIFPEVSFWVELEIMNEKFYKKDYPKLYHMKTYHVKTTSEFFEVMDSWPKFAKTAISKIRKNRKEWLEYLPADSRKYKEAYYYLDEHLLTEIKQKTDVITNFGNTE